MSTEGFSACEVCGAQNWEIAFSGPVRDGAFGRLTESTQVGRCGTCGVERLQESAAKSDDFYQTKDYRTLLAQSTDAVGFFAEHDVLQLQNLEQLWPESIRGQTIADIGCAAGSFLDHVRGLAGRQIAVEPCQEYHESLASRGYEVHSYPGQAEEAGVRADRAFTFSVIEHVDNPREFLSDIRSLLKPGGQLLLSTPNRKDVLMSLLPEVYPSFFYRTVHRWYFDRDSLAECARQAGFKVKEIRCVHRFGLSNTLVWLRDKKPGGRQPIEHVGTPLMNDVWARTLESRDVGDYLFAILTNEDN